MVSSIRSPTDVLFSNWGWWCGFEGFHQAEAQIITFLNFQASDLPHTIFWYYWDKWQHCKSWLTLAHFGSFFVSTLGLQSVKISGFFFHSDFTWNQFYRFQKYKICHFYTLAVYEFWFLWMFALFDGWNLSNWLNSLPQKWRKLQF